MQLLITGGAGFIGSNFARAATAAGHEVRVIDDLSTSLQANLKGVDCDFRKASILDADALQSAATGVDSIVHLAALGSVPRSVANPVATHRANADGTFRVLESARANDVPQVIVSSSSSVYGANPALPKHEREWVRPMSPYAASKLAAEQYALAYQSTYGLHVLAFRFFNVYGPYQSANHAYAAVIPIFIAKLLRGEALDIDGDGTQSRDFTYVGSVCDVLLEAVRRKVTHPEPVNLAFGTNTSVNDLVTLLSDLTGKKAVVRYRQSRVGDVPHSQADSTVLRSVFESAAPVPLRIGLADTIDWALRHNLPQS